jgi:hypothetical protein
LPLFARSLALVLGCFLLLMLSCASESEPKNEVGRYASSRKNGNRENRLTSACRRKSNAAAAAGCLPSLRRAPLCAGPVNQNPVSIATVKEYALGVER